MVVAGSVSFLMKKEKGNSSPAWNVSEIFALARGGASQLVRI
jgi:hypothetical protein